MHRPRCSLACGLLLSLGLGRGEDLSLTHSLSLSRSLCSPQIIFGDEWLVTWTAEGIGIVTWTAGASDVTEGGGADTPSLPVLDHTPLYSPVFRGRRARNLTFGGPADHFWGRMARDPGRLHG